MPYSVFGETLSEKELLADLRCTVKRSMFFYRLGKGMSPEEAMTKPAEQKISLEERVEMLDDEKTKRYLMWLDKNPKVTREQKRKRANFLFFEERARESSDKYRVRNWDKKLAYQRKWRKDNPDKRRFHELSRERRLHNTPDHLLPTNAQLAEWKELYGQRCCYCESTENLTLEHIVPISKGGFHTLENILWACQSCNSSKKDETFIIWLWKKCNKSTFN